MAGLKNLSAKQTVVKFLPFAFIMVHSFVAYADLYGDDE